MMNWLEHTPAAPGMALHVNVASLDQLLQELEGKFLRGEGFSVATLNLDHVDKLRRLSEFRAAYLDHTYVTADGNPIVWLSRLAGDPVSLVPGADLLTPVIELAVRLRTPIALYGSTDASLQRTAEALKARYPDIVIAACIAPPMGFDPDGAIAEEHVTALQQAGARLCLLALGAPKQELLAAKAQHIAPEMGFLSIGAGLDFISGHQRRAPGLVRLLAIEWLWRLALNPIRLAGRYGRCFLLLPMLLSIAIKTRWRRRYTR